MIRACGFLALAVSLSAQEAQDPEPRHRERLRFLLVEALLQDNPKLRKDAIDELCRAGEEAAPLVVRYLEEGRKRKGPVEDWIATLIEDLDNDDVSVRDAATVRLLALGPPAAEPLRRALASTLSEVRARAKMILDAIPGLPPGPSEREVQEIDLLRVLSRIGNRGHLEWVLPYLSHEKKVFRLAGLEAWARLATRGDLGTLEPALKDADPDIRRQALLSLASVGRDRAALRLLEFLKGEKIPDLRDAATKKLFELRPTWDASIAPAILDAAEKAEPPLQASLLRGMVLARATQGPHADRFGKILLASSPESKLAGLSPAFPWSSPPGPALLVRLAADPDGNVAKAALGTIGGLTVPNLSGGRPAGKGRMFKDLCDALTGTEDAGARRAVLAVLYGGARMWTSDEIAAGLGSADPQIFAAALGALEDPRVSVMTWREGLPVTLGPLETPAGAELLPLARRLFSSSVDPRVQTRLAVLLGQAGDATGRDLVPGALASTDPVVRARAARAAGRLGLKETSATLAGSTSDADGAVRAAALWSLLDLRAGPGAAAGVICLEDREENVRLVAVHLVGRVGGPKDVASLAGRITDSSAAVRRELVTALEYLAIASPPDALRELVKDMDPGVRDAARLAALRIDRRKELHNRFDDLASDNAEVRYPARESLRNAELHRIRYRIEPGAGDIGERPFAEDGSVRLSEETLAAVLVSPDPSVRWVAEVILARGAAEAPPAVLRKLDLPAHRIVALEALRRLKFRNSIEPIKSLIRDPKNSPIRAYCLRVLREIDPSEAASLGPSADADPASIREHVASLLLLPRDRAAQRLAELLEHPDRTVREGAKAGIVEQRMVEVLSHLHRSYSQGKLIDSRVAADVLAGLSVHTDMAFALLIEFVKDKDRSTRLVAAEALVKGRGPDAIEWVLPVLKESEASWPLLDRLGGQIRPKDLPSLESAAAEAAVKDKTALYYLLARGGRPEYRAKLADALPAADWQKAHAFRAFEGCRDAPVVRRLSEAALSQSPQWLERMAAVLVTTHLPEAHPALLRYLSVCTSPDETFESCLDALLEAPSESHLDTLRGLIKKGWVGKKEQIYRLLGRIGTEGSAAALLEHYQGGGRKGATWAEAFLACRKDERAVARILSRLALPEDVRPDESAFCVAVASTSGLPLERTRGALEAILRARFYPGKRLGFLRVPTGARLLAAGVLSETEEGRKALDAAAKELRASSDAYDRGVACVADWMLGRPINPFELKGLPYTFHFVAYEARFPQFVAPEIESYRDLGTGNYAEYVGRTAARVQVLACRELFPPARADLERFPADRESYLAEVEEWIRTYRGRRFEEILLDGFRLAGYDLGASLDREDLPTLVRALRDRRWFIGHNAAWALCKLTGDPAERLRRVRLRRLLLSERSDQNFFYDPAPVTEEEASFWEAWVKKNEKGR